MTCAISVVTSIMWWCYIIAVDSLPRWRNVRPTVSAGRFEVLSLSVVCGQHTSMPEPTPHTWASCWGMLTISIKLASIISNNLLKLDLDIMLCVTIQLKHNSECIFIYETIVKIRLKGSICFNTLSSSHGSGSLCVNVTDQESTVGGFDPQVLMHALEANPS